MTLEMVREICSTATWIAFWMCVAYCGRSYRVYTTSARIDFDK